MDLARAHVLLQVDPGRSHEAARYLAGLPAVTEAVVTSGPYDVIATVQAADGELAQTVASARRAPGLCALRLCRATTAEAAPRSRG